MHVLIAGSSGFLGSRLTAELTSAGHHVTPLVRREPGQGERAWAPYDEPLDPAVLADVDVVVNLAGSPMIGNVHSAKWAEELEHSRVVTTRRLAEAIAAQERPPAFLAGNGISFYGDHGGAPLTESAHPIGDNFLGRVAQVWEAATEAAVAAGARVAVLRTAPVMDRAAAPMKMLAPLFRIGLGAKLGSGRQRMPMITARDWTGAVRFLAEHDEVSGPVNVCCEETPTNAEFTRALAHAVRRPAVLPVPSPLIKVGAGPMSPELLGSMRTVPQTLLDAGYAFRDPDVSAVVATALAGR